MSNTVDDQAARPESGRAGRGKTALVSVLILLAGVALMVLIFKTEPTATRGDVARETAMLVEVRSAERGRFTPVIEVMGRVVPAREVTLQPRVSGRVIELAEAFEPGGRVAEGTALLRIDPADYEAALRQRRSELAQARADLELEQGRQAVAEQDFELLGEELDEGNRHLVLRQPQLKQARARVDFAEAALRRAELDLQRTRISAPFDAQILSRDVATGSQVSTGDSLAGWWPRTVTGCRPAYRCRNCAGCASPKRTASRARPSPCATRPPGGRHGAARAACSGWSASWTPTPAWRGCWSCQTTT